MLARSPKMNSAFTSKLAETPLEGEHLHPYTLGTVSEDKCHGKEQIYIRTKNPDCIESIRTSINTAELRRKHNVHPQAFHN